MLLSHDTARDDTQILMYWVCFWSQQWVHFARGFTAGKETYF